MDPRSPPEADVQNLISSLRLPSKPQLQAICSANGLSKTGNKAELQGRITDRDFSLVMSEPACRISSQHPQSTQHQQLQSMTLPDPAPHARVRGRTAELS